MDLLKGLNQPSIDENIKKANDILDDYIKGVNKLPKVQTDVKSIDLSNFDDVVLLILNVVVNDTQLDDRLIKILSALIKNAVPGEQFEPLMGKLLVELGEQLQEK